MILLSKGKHKFTIESDGDIPGSTTIILDHTQFPDTIWMTWKRGFIEQQFQTYDLADMMILWERYHIGWQIFFALDYSNSANVDTIYDAGRIEDLQSNNNKILKLMVRDDDTSFNIPVLSVTDEITLRLLWGDDAYEGLKLFFKSDRTYKNLNFIKPLAPGVVLPGGGTGTPFEGGVQT